MRIIIVDYEMGNLGSVQKAFQALGVPALLTQQPDEIAAAQVLVLPGVGAFDAAMNHLERLNLIHPIQEYLQAGHPFLGICLGLQLLFERSEEGKLPGLSIYKGTVKRFHPKDPSLKIPHMGWNGIQVKDPANPFLKGIDPESFVYFVHSYFVDPVDVSLVSTETDFGGKFVSSIARGKLFATQFHPEKSGAVGLKILENFVKTVAKGRI